MESRVDQVSLLDLLVVLAENAKLMLLGPLLTGILALAVCFALIQKFVSAAVLFVPATPQSPAHAIANAVIDAGVKNTKPAEQDSKDMETRLTYAKASLPSTLLTEHASPRKSLTGAIGTQSGTANKLDRLQAAFKTK